MKIELKENWKLAGSWPFNVLRGTSMELGNALCNVTPTIDAKVPGSVHDDLLRAGLIADPYFECDSLKCEWVPNRFWTYMTAFSVPCEYEEKRIRLVLKGVDYHAHVILNGEKIAEHVGMYAPCVVEIGDKIKFGEENQLAVALENAPDEMGQIGYTSRTFTQKARFNYKWDFGTRLIHLGLYDEVYLDVADDPLTDVHIRYLGGIAADADYGDDGQIDRAPGGQAAPETGLLEVTAANEQLSGTLLFHGQVIAEAGARDGRLLFEIGNPRLWYPNNAVTESDAQPLYDLILKTADDEKSYRVGLRTISYKKPACADETVLPYIPVINGKEIYIKGVNMTPLDHMYGRVTRERYREMLKLAKEANVNLIRVWGGGLIEKEDFYELCDEYGIMVWQEFIQSSSGIDNIPSKRPEFLKLCEQTARAVIPEKRNHVCLTFWSGGNELMDENGIPSTFEDENIAMLKDIVEELNPEIQMLPTSASGPTEWFDPDDPSRNQDIHGPWKYEGVEGQYDLYNRSTILLHSEFGVDGMSNLDSIHTVLGPANRSVTTIEDNLVWRHHGEWWDTYAYRERPLFGQVEKLEDLVKLSQFMQAEGLRYAIEAHRRRAVSASPARLAEGELKTYPAQNNVGSIVWQFNEPWPNVYCTCMVDFYAKPKLVYYFYRDAQEPLHVSMRYGKLLWKPGEIFEGSVFVHDDRDEGYDSVEVRTPVAAEFSGNRIRFTVPDGDSFRVECVLKKGETEKTNVYLFLIGEMGSASQEAVIRFVDEYQKGRVGK